MQACALHLRGRTPNQSRPASQPPIWTAVAKGGTNGATAFAVFGDLRLPANTRKRQLRCRPAPCICAAALQTRAAPQASLLYGLRSRREERPQLPLSPSSADHAFHKPPPKAAAIEPPPVHHPTHATSRSKAAAPPSLGCATHGLIRSPFGLLPVVCLPSAVCHSAVFVPLRSGSKKRCPLPRPIRAITAPHASPSRHWLPSPPPGSG